MKNREILEQIVSEVEELDPELEAELIDLCGYEDDLISNLND